jgi:hypothetical protein
MWETVSSPMCRSAMHKYYVLSKNTPDTQTSWQQTSWQFLKRPDSFSNVLTVSQTSWQKFQFDTILPNVLSQDSWHFSILIKNIFGKKMWVLIEVQEKCDKGIYIGRVIPGSTMCQAIVLKHDFSPGYDPR